jgi:tRNA dimethylallyltransferase
MGARRHAEDRRDRGAREAGDDRRRHGLLLARATLPFFHQPADGRAPSPTHHGPEHLYRMLRRIDPRAASKLFPRDWPRVQRALEVRLQTGQSLSDLVGIRTEPPACAARIRVLALLPPRQELYRKINERTEAHFAVGLAEEACILLNLGVPRESNALGAHGYRRVVEFLQGEREYASAIEQTKLDVRHYAKRQLTWFRREPDVEWFEGFGDDPLVQERFAARIKELIER